MSQSGQVATLVSNARERETTTARNNGCTNYSACAVAEKDLAIVELLSAEIGWSNCRVRVELAVDAAELGGQVAALATADVGGILDRANSVDGAQEWVICIGIEAVIFAHFVGLRTAVPDKIVVLWSTRLESAVNAVVLRRCVAGNACGVGAGTTCQGTAAVDDGAQDVSLEAIVLVNLIAGTTTCLLLSEAADCGDEEKGQRKTRHVGV